MKKLLFLSFVILISIGAIASGNWTKQSDFPGAARYTSGASFVIGHYGFTGCGTDGTTNYKDFYKWNQSTNSWSAIANYPGAGYANTPVGFSIEGKGYVGLGYTGSGVAKDLWQYDTIAGWTAMTTFPGTGRYDASVFVMGHKAFVLGGSAGGQPYLSDMWMYDAHQNSWKQMNNCPAGNIEGMATFTIGNHAYIGGGWSGSNDLTSFWEYDSTNDSWSAIASIPVTNGLGGTARSFVIGSKAFIFEGTKGSGAVTLSDGYVYDTITKAWSVFTNMGANGIERYYAVAFSIGNYGYVCSGKDSIGNILNDLWQYNPQDTVIDTTPNNICNTWAKKSDFPGAARYTSGASFVIGHYGFTGCGTDGTTNYKDFYKWNQSTNGWSAIANYPGAGYANTPVGFSIEGKGYVGLGYTGSGVAKDLWQYDTVAGWTSMATFPGTGRYDASVFVMGHKAFVVGGSAGGSPYLSDVWMYDAHQNSWKQMNNCPAGSAEGMATFTIGNHAYIGGGWNNSSDLTSFWEYDSTNDSWSAIAGIPVTNGLGGTARSFVIGSRAYICEGTKGSGAATLSDGYVYDTITKSWSVFANMGANGIERYYAVAFSIGNYGYICSGKDSLGNILNDLWQYYPCADTSTPPVCLLHASFSDTIGSNGHVAFKSTSKGTVSNTKYSWNAGDGIGISDSSKFDYTYLNNGTYSVSLEITDSTGNCSSDTLVVITISNLVPPSCNIWTQKANFTGAARYTSGASFVIGHYGFTGCGTDGTTNYKDFYKWNQSTNSWSAIANYPGAGCANTPVGFSIEGKGYVGLGYTGSGVAGDLWQYDTLTSSWTQKASLPGSARYDASVFVIGHKAFIVGGSAGGQPYLSDVWMYDAHQNSWKQMNNCPAGNVEGMAAFTIGNHAYIGGGWNGSNDLTSFWEYDSTNDSWTPIASIPVTNGLGGTARSFVIGSRAFICEATDGSGSSTISSGYEYDTITKGWSVFTNMSANGIARYYSVAFAIGSYGYIATGINSSGISLSDLWQYYPCSDTLSPIPKCNAIYASFTSSIGSAGKVTFTSTSSGTTSSTKYAWDFGDGKGTGSSSTSTYTYLKNGVYAVNLYVSDTTGLCTSDTTINVTVTNAAGCALHSDFSVLTGSNGQVACNSTSSGTGAGTQYYWNAGNNSGGGNGSSFLYTYAYNGTYGINLFVTDSTSSCSSDTTIYVTISNAAVCNLKADFTYTTGSNGQVNFNSTSTGMTGTSQLYWYTGDSIGYGYGNPYSYTYQKNGTYPVTLSLSNTTAGCTSDTTINVTISNATNAAGTCSLGITLQSAKASCDTCNDGGATVTATSGTGPYSYHWSNGATTTSIVAKPGIYTCCVTDAGGCSACANTTVTDSCLYAEFTYTVKNNTAGDSAVISFVSISDTVCHDSTHGPSKPLKSVSYTWNFGDGNSQTISGIGVRTSTHSFSTNGTYNITLAINREGSQVKSIAIKPLKLSTPTGPTGIRSLSNSADIKLFPNPNNGLFMLAIGGVADNQEATLQVSNLLGEVVYTSSAHSSNGTIRKEIDLTNVSAGTYFVRVVTATKVYVSKVLVVR